MFKVQTSNDVIHSLFLSNYLEKDPPQKDKIIGRHCIKKISHVTIPQN